MARKPVPDFMKTYMENIGPDSWLDFDNLAQQYHGKVQEYHEKIFPNQSTNLGNSNRMTGERKTVDLQAQLSRYKEEYKDQALKLACEKYGYEDPGFSDHDEGFSDIQEQSSVFNHGLNEDKFGKTPEDVRADKAHASYIAKNPKTQQEQEIDRNFVEEEYGEKRPDYYQPILHKTQNITKPKRQEPEKEVDIQQEVPENGYEKQDVSLSRYEQQLSSSTYRRTEAEKVNLKKGFANNGKDIDTDKREMMQKAKDFATNREDIFASSSDKDGNVLKEEDKREKPEQIKNETQPSKSGSERYLSSLSSERALNEPEVPDMYRGPAQENNNIELSEPDI